MTLAGEIGDWLAVLIGILALLGMLYDDKDDGGDRTVPIAADT